MKTSFVAGFILLLMSHFTFAKDIAPVNKLFGKNEIKALAETYVNNSFHIKNPAIVDVDGDGDFDLLNFTKKGKVEYYKNTGTLESPVFILENKNYDSYEVSSFLPSGLPVPVFFADNDGDNDKDVFGIVKEDSKYDVMFIENTMDLDHYTLITIILVLVIVLLVVLILK